MEDAEAFQQGLKPLRQGLDEVQENLRRVKAARGLDPDEDLVADWELEEFPETFLPTEWQQPATDAQAEHLESPWREWEQNYLYHEIPTILDWMTGIREIRAWWDPDSEFHQLVAAKLIVMETREDPEAVTIELATIRQMSPDQQWEQVVGLHHVVQEVLNFQQVPVGQRPNLVDSLEVWAKRIDRPMLLEDVQEVRAELP